MPLQRQSRPLVRDSKSLRDDRLFIVGCDDTYAPKQYFGFFRIPRIQVHVIPTVDGTSTAQQVLNRLTSIAREPDDEVWMLLDTDHCTQGTHLQGFVAALKEAQQKGVRVALSKPCFEIWLLFHHLDEANVETLSRMPRSRKILARAIGWIQQDELEIESLPAGIRGHRLRESAGPRRGG